MSKPALYLTNLATVRGGDAAAVGQGPVLGILRAPPAWARTLLEGHVPALMPRKATLWAAKTGALGWAAYQATLRAEWTESDLGPGQLRIVHRGRHRSGGREWDGARWWPGDPVPEGATLVCTCAVGERCHRQLAAELLAAAGWRVVLDGVSLERVDAPEQPRLGL